MMIKGSFPLDAMRRLPTPFYYYDVGLLERTVDLVCEEMERYDFHEHYAVKANANPRVLKIIAERGLGADCVSGGEIKAALEAGIPPSKVVFAGVGKADWEINYALDHEIFCFNVESLEELRVINELAREKGRRALTAIRVNPNINAKTHAKITTGLQENKFGVNLGKLPEVLDEFSSLSHVQFIGLHCHIGSQITDMSAFRDLAIRVNVLQDELEAAGVEVRYLNFGGGLGIDYGHPNHLSIPDFETYFAVFNKLVKRRPGQQIHFELGRSIVGQCGSLISKVLYVKEGEVKKYAILDAGFTELIRPAMYNAYHRIENISNNEPTEIYDVVGPICESSDVFGFDVELNRVQRHDLVALRSAGAYGEVMASHYNCRTLPNSYFSDQL